MTLLADFGIANTRTKKGQVFYKEGRKVGKENGKRRDRKKARKGRLPAMAPISSFPAYFLSCLPVFLIK
jgi:hypothetical protein